MKNSTLIVMTVVASVASSAQAEIFKCTVNGKTAYQAAPCQDEKHESTLDRVKITDEAANERARQRLAEAEAQRLEKKLLEAEIAAEQAAANERNASAEASRAWADSSVRQADAAEERAAAVARAHESAAKARFYNRNSPGRPFHQTEDH